jgi:hypothetical protein
MERPYPSLRPCYSPTSRSCKHIKRGTVPGCARLVTEILVLMDKSDTRLRETPTESSLDTFLKTAGEVDPGQKTSRPTGVVSFDILNQERQSRRARVTEEECSPPLTPR